MQVYFKDWSLLPKSFYDEIKINGITAVGYSLASSLRIILHDACMNISHCKLDYFNTIISPRLDNKGMDFVDIHAC